MVLSAVRLLVRRGEVSSCLVLVESVIMAFLIKILGVTIGVQVRLVEQMLIICISMMKIRI